MKRLLICILVGIGISIPVVYFVDRQRVSSELPAVVVRPPSRIPAGLSINTDRAFPGYSLLSPMNSTSTYLIDMDARVVREWKSEFRPALSACLLENGRLLRPALCPANGFNGPGTGGRIQEFDWDGNLVWDFTLSTDRLHPHHDVCKLPNGNVLMIATDRKTKVEAIASGRLPAAVYEFMKPDCILEVKPTGLNTGEIVWEWHAWDHLIQDYDDAKPNYGEPSEHPELINVNFGASMMDTMLTDPQELNRLRSLGYVGGRAPRKGPNGGFSKGDWMHTNSVAYNAEFDQILISVYEFSEIWIIDHSTTTVEAASHAGGRSGKGGDLLYRWGNPLAYRRGENKDQQLFVQHSAHWIPVGTPGAGHVLLFNNGTGRPQRTYSSVDELVLPVDSQGQYANRADESYLPEAAAWTYTTKQPTDFYSALVSGAQRLPNGNTLICSGIQRWVFEVAPEGEIVWQYRLPEGDKAVRPPHRDPAVGGQTELDTTSDAKGLGGLFRCHRYATDYAGFAGKQLKAGPQLEDSIKLNTSKSSVPATDTDDSSSN
ncbi:aryl-sulfate sulfotransferase [Planctomicrobium piriforme]|uniref:Arylsulfotransferase (ASST) n=1 Tax=Planctomicrobium piriforme TaxID=1576369 RepID=A0A1I3QBV1_9PLAN|nr:aryl-sulfate sulfotransferase [Planctomicrobium piriforme]SFJ31059.1 Arylsulfotransferase (ASST) [Planctomicrobium piriforme]